VTDSNSDLEPTVQDDTAHHRFVLEQDCALAELVYQTEPDRLILVHTEVPDTLGGRGIGGQLVRAAVARASAEQLTLVPWCPFARRWLEGHPDVAETVAIDWAIPGSAN
jgi:uncharacterized protein